jgi:hypothetical protein
MLIKENMISTNYPFTLLPSNLYKLDENVKSTSNCLVPLYSEIMKDNNINPEKFIKNNLTATENEKLDKAMNIRKYDISKCFADTQISSIKFLTNKLATQKGEQNVSSVDIENIINYVKTNIKKSNVCNLVSDSCELNDADKKILNEYKF